MTTDKFEVLSGRDQILRRSEMWVGSMNLEQKQLFIINDNKVEYKTIEYIPAFKKIIDEILDNSLDALIQNCNATGKISVEMTENRVRIEDNGPGIPVIKKKLSEAEIKSLPKEEAEKLSNMYIPEIAWTRLFSGTNFQDFSDKTSIGSHGVGSKAAAIFSTEFIGKTDDGKKSCTVTVVNNLEKSTCKVSKTSNTSGTIVEFKPDLKRFKLDKIEDIYFKLMQQRLLCLSMTFPNISFSFNKSRINVNDKKFLKMFSENIEILQFDTGFIGVFPNEQDEFNFFTYVNGMHMNRGGTHIEHVSYQIINPIREKLCKKYKSIKPGDIKNKLTVVCFFRDFANPKFDSQTKETLTNSPADVVKYFGNKVDFEKFAKQILKNDAIINPIIDTFKIKEELKARQELKKVKKVRVKSDKYFPGIGDKKYLFLVEGLSAGGGLMKCLGRDQKYYFCLRGLALNAYDSTIQKIAANQEIKDVLNILNLDISKKNENLDIEFEKIVIATDADVDGINISSMLFGWWYKLCPELYKQHKIYKLNTPVVIVKDNKDKIKNWFFTFNDFKQWEAKQDKTTNKLKIIYLKGLGSLETKDLDYIIEQNGFDSLLEEYHLDEQSLEYIDNWLGSNAEPRKKYIKEFDLDLERI